MVLDEHGEQHGEGERRGARDLVERHADALHAQVVEDEHVRSMNWRRSIRRRRRHLRGATPATRRVR